MNASKFRTYSIISALALALGETWFVLTTDKYPPLWLDDYFAAAALLAAAYWFGKTYGPALLLASWTFVLGNLYAMLFTRLEPVNPPDRPWALLAVLVLWALASCVVALVLVVREDQGPP